MDYVGTSLMEGLDRDPTGQPAAAIRDETLLYQIVNAAELAQRFHRPVTENGSYADKQGNMHLFRSIVLPFLSFEGDVRYVLGAASFKTVGRNGTSEDRSAYVFEPETSTLLPLETEAYSVTSTAPQDH